MEDSELSGKMITIKMSLILRKTVGIVKMVNLILGTKVQNVTLSVGKLKMIMK